MQQAQTAATDAATKADAAQAQATQQQQTVTELKSDVTDLKTNMANTVVSMQETQKSVSESPAALHFKGITITPGGFLAAESVRRSRALASDVNTPFNSITMPGASASNISEFFGSGRQSRVSMLAEGRLGSAKLSGYVEADFLSAGITSNNNQSNSYTLRQRQVWGQAAFDNGCTFTGGQMWSLVTETKHGVDNRSEALPMTIDAAVHTWVSVGRGSMVCACRRTSTTKSGSRFPWKIRRRRSLPTATPPISWSARPARAAAFTTPPSPLAPQHQQQHGSGYNHLQRGCQLLLQPVA